MISIRIKELRIEHNLTQNQLGEKISVSQDTISLWENNKSLPATKQIIALCRLLSVSADYLLGLSDIYPCTVKKIVTVQGIF